MYNLHIHKRVCLCACIYVCHEKLKRIFVSDELKMKTDQYVTQNLFLNIFSFRFLKFIHRHRTVYNTSDTHNIILACAVNSAFKRALCASNNVRSKNWFSPSVLDISSQSVPHILATALVLDFQ
jgi:hypothetical protein